MRLLITNDDGIYSPGIALLAEVALAFGEVRIVAPDVERSSAGHSITSSVPLSYKRTPIANIEAYRVNGTPADCVSLGLFNWSDVDVVLSGVNVGSNLGNAVWHSGTLAGAKQAALFGARGIAFSTPSTDSEPDWSALKPWVARVLEHLLPATDLRLVNVNLPAKRPRGIAWSRMLVEQYDGRIIPGTDPSGRKHFWYTVTPIETPSADTDLFAIRDGYVSLTPLRLDLTDDAALQRARRDLPLDDIRFD